MLTYEQRLKKIKSRENLDDQIRLAGEALKKHKLLVKKTTPLSEKIALHRKTREYDDVWYKLKFEYYDILAVLGE